MSMVQNTQHVKRKSRATAKIVYEVIGGEAGSVDCSTLDQAYNKLKNIHKMECEGYIVRKKYNKNDKVIEEYFIG